MTTLWLILGIILLASSLVFTVRPVIPATFAAYASLWLIKWSGAVPMPPAILAFWGVATLLVLCIDFLLPRQVTASRAGLAYLGGGSLAGMLVGLIFSYPLMIAGAAVGAVLGAMAYSRTPGGKTIKFPSSRFIQYLCAKGLPIIVTICIIGVVMELFLMTGRAA